MPSFRSLKEGRRVFLAESQKEKKVRELVGQPTGARHLTAPDRQVRGSPGPARKLKPKQYDDLT